MSSAGPSKRAGGYWTCTCGAWTHCSGQGLLRCYGCKQPAPWASKRARERSRGGRPSRPSSKAATPSSAMSDASSEGASEQAEALRVADEEVKRLEAVPEASRSLVPGFKELLEAAKERKAVLVEAKTATKPWKARYDQAFRLAERRATAAARLRSEVDDLEAKRAELAKQLQAKREELATAEEERARSAAVLEAVRLEPSSPLLVTATPPPSLPLPESALAEGGDHFGSGRSTGGQPGSPLPGSGRSTGGQPGSPA